MGKKFIDKKKALTYRLVPRETGPDQFEEGQPKHTFVLVPNKKNKAAANVPSPFEDGTRKPVAAERVFPSKGPRPDWDPDVVACLDDDFDFEDPDNVLEDDFIAKANADASLEKDSIRRFRFNVRKEKDDEESFGSDFGGDFSEEESVDGSFSFKGKSKSKLTQYSMTSAISNCTEDIQLLNDKFEKLLDEYDDDQIGALDGEDIEGKGTTTEDYAVTQFLNKKCPGNDEFFIPEKCEEDLKDKILEKASNSKDGNETLVKVVVEERPVDCISISGSCRSTAYQPALIPVERRRTSSSSTVQSSVKLQDTEKVDDKMDLRKLAAINAIRLKNETPEQRKERKQLVKSVRKESRVLKKEVKLAFKNEKKKQSFVKANVHSNVGFKL